jgi:hypothetical protein
MPSLGALTVTLGAVTDKFRGDIGQSTILMERADKAMLKLVASAGKLGLAAGAAGIAITAGLVKTGMDFIDTQSDMARSIGGTIDGLRGMQIAAQDAGVESGELTGALALLDRKIGEAQRGVAETKKTFDALGLSAAALSGMDVDQRMAAIADRVQELGLSSQQASDALGKLGIKNADLTTLMREGGDAIRAARQEVDDFGLSVSDVEAEQVQAAADALERVGRVIEGVRNQLTIALAPILEEVANRFNDMVKANGGFAEASKKAAEIGIRGFAKVADVVQGLRVVFKGVELIARGFGAAFVSTVELAVTAMVKLENISREVVNKVIEYLNELPGIELTPFELIDENDGFLAALHEMGETARNKVGEVREELQSLAMQEMPSAKLEEFFAAVAARSEEAAKATVAAREQLGTGLAGFMDEEAEKLDEQRKKDLEKLQEHLKSRLEVLQESVMTETELEISKHEQNLKDLEAALEQELILEDGYRALREDLEEAHMKALKEIREKGMTEMEKFNAMSWDRQTDTLLGNIVQMTAGVANGNKKMFQLNKAAALAQAIVSLPAAVIETFKNNGGWPWGAVAAGVMAAAGLAQIQQIRSAQYGGGTAPSAAGTTAASPVSNVGSGGPQSGTGSGGGGKVVTLRGLDPASLFSGKQVRMLIESIQSELDDGAKLVIG